MHVHVSKPTSLAPVERLGAATPPTQTSTNDVDRAQLHGHRFDSSSAASQGPIQMTKKKGKLRAGMEKAQKKQQQKQEVHDPSWVNIQAYRGGWVTRNDITQDHIKQFKKATGRKIRGHHSGDNSKGEQGNTTEDLNAYKSWHTQNFGWK